LVKEKRDQVLKEQAKLARKQSKKQAASNRLGTAVQESQVAITRLQPEGITLTSISASDLAGKCSAKELESLLLTNDPQAKKGNKADMAARIVACVMDITAAAARAPVTATATATEP